MTSEKEDALVRRSRVQMGRFSRAAARAVGEDPTQYPALERLLAEGFRAGVNWCTQGAVRRVERRSAAWNRKVIRVFKDFSVRRKALP